MQNHTFIAEKISCSRQNKLLFDSLSFHLQCGELLVIEGANGTGKSSLLRLLSGLATPTNGAIAWCGQSIDTNTLTYAEARHYIGHTNGIKLGLTVNENLTLMHHLHGGISHDIEATLTRLQLLPYKHTIAASLSAGQKRRIALAKLCLFKKPLWLLDEPLTALDTVTQAVFLAELEAHLAQGGIGVISTHQPIALNRPIQTLRLTA